MVNRIRISVGMLRMHFITFGSLEIVLNCVTFVQYIIPRLFRSFIGFLNSFFVLSECFNYFADLTEKTAQTISALVFGQSNTKRNNQEINYLIFVFRVIKSTFFASTLCPYFLAASRSFSNVAFSLDMRAISASLVFSTLDFFVNSICNWSHCAVTSFKSASALTNLPFVILY